MQEYRLMCGGAACASSTFSEILAVDDQIAITIAQNRSEEICNRFYWRFILMCGSRIVSSWVCERVTRVRPA
jgi:hypothetical protein